MARVLIVDDNTDVRESFGVVCELWGHEVALAADGGEALALVAAFRPDVVLLDLGLPGQLCGAEVARRIRDMEGRRVYLIALTGWTRPEDRESALGAGVDVFVVKPPDLEELRRLVEIGALSERAGRWS